MDWPPWGSFPRQKTSRWGSPERTPQAPQRNTPQETASLPNPYLQWSNGSRRKLDCGRSIERERKSKKNWLWGPRFLSVPSLGSATVFSDAGTSTRPSSHCQGQSGAQHGSAHFLTHVTISSGTCPCSLDSCGCHPLTRHLSKRKI